MVSPSCEARDPKNDAISADLIAAGVSNGFQGPATAPLPIPKPCPEDPDTKFVRRFMSGFNWKKASRNKFQVMWIPQTLYLPCIHCQSDSAKSQVILIDKVTFHRAMFTYVIYNVQFHKSPQSFGYT